MRILMLDVMRGLDPGIHVIFEKRIANKSGWPGQARP